MSRSGKKWRRWLLALGVAFLLAQLVPYGHRQDNPPVRQEPPWDSPRTRELAARACFDCHSNETRWLWYHRVAPASWLVVYDVTEARGKLNFSEWDRPQRKADDAAEEVTEGEMPLWRYLVLHPEAVLSDRERQELAQGLAATVGDGEDGKAPRSRKREG